MALAERDHRILISADTDFGELLANSAVQAPSLILIRRSDRRAGPLAAVIIANLAPIGDDLDAGALIVISDTRVRTRRLPLRPPD
jgi:predicted nuclease of predicted toxin-antitoxin system